jgi:hypothetical protein
VNAEITDVGIWITVDTAADGESGHLGMGSQVLLGDRKKLVMQMQACPVGAYSKKAVSLHLQV